MLHNAIIFLNGSSWTKPTSSAASRLTKTSPIVPYMYWSCSLWLTIRSTMLFSPSIHGLRVFNNS